MWSVEERTAFSGETNEWNGDEVEVWGRKKLEERDLTGNQAANWLGMREDGAQINVTQATPSHRRFDTLFPVFTRRGKIEKKTGLPFPLLHLPVCSG